MTSNRDRGPLRYRGNHDELKDQHLINLEQQLLEGRDRREKDPKMKLFHSPESFFTSNWTPGLWIVVSMGYLALVTFIVCLLHRNLPTPTPLNTSPNVQDDSQRFIAARAQADLNSLINMGPRPVGSNENEVLARDFILGEILKIQEKSNKALTISSDNQIVSGSFHIKQNSYGYSSFYHNVQNIVIRLSSRNQSNPAAVLVNCHYDTVPGSPGASDDAFHCAVMLELLRIFSLSSKPLLHDIIFLFNGAEESGLQASHGFVTKHEWAQNVKTFVNLEGCGAGGKEVLFQTGPNCPWLVETYANAVPHPYGSVMGEELFQSGVVPSDTDFRIFRDFGHIPGVDFANVDNGFVYHTKFDNGMLVPLGSYQHTGDNMLALVQALANSSSLENVDQSGVSMVYFDFFGLWFIHYSKTTGALVNTVMIILSLLTTFVLLQKMMKDAGLVPPEVVRLFLFGVLGIILGWILSVLYIYLLTTFLNWMRCTQTWYRSYFYQIYLYYCPTVLFCILVPFVIFNQRSKLSNMQQAQISSLGTQFIWTIVLLIGTIFGIRSSYLILILILSATIANAGLIFCRNYCGKLWVAVQLLHTAVPLMIGIYHTIMAMSVFVPITNRSGSVLNVELYIGILSAATCIMMISFLVPLSMFIRHVSVVVSIATVHILGLLIVLTVQPFPFYEWQSGESGVLQRVPIWHVQRTLYDKYGDTRLSDSGYWVINMDPSAPYTLKSAVLELNSAGNATEFCGSELFCALPLYSPRLTNFVRQSKWIPAPMPFGQSILQMQTKVEQLTPSMKRMRFTISGPQQMSFMFSPVKGVTASHWSLEANLTESTPFNERPAYFVFYQRGLDGSPWSFYIDFTFDDPQKFNSNETVTVGLAGSHIHPDEFSPEFKNFINKFPNWAFVSPRASELKIWEL